MRPEYEKDSARQIVGIVGDVRDTVLNRPPRPAMYVPIAQLPDGINIINLQAFADHLDRSNPSRATFAQLGDPE